jgi:hypothetical protein
MAACARREIVRQGLPGIFHIWQRCVRRCYLLGTDPDTGQDCHHRREWIIERLQLLAANFAIDVGFLALMSNHFHLVLRTTPRLVDRMGSWEVARRWLRVYPGKRVLDGHWIEPTDEQVQALAEDKDKIATLRKRLSNVSWFMAALSEYVARRSNREDDRDGRFFSGRYRCREIRTDGGLLIAGMYVDLNQLRAGEVLTPEDSQHCSVWYRIQARRTTSADISQRSPDDWLAALTLAADHVGDVPSDNGRRASDKGLLPISLEDYLRLLDWAGRETRAGKRGAIPADLAPILERLGLAEDEFLEAVEKFPDLFPRLAGPVSALVERAQQVGRRWMHGVGPAAKVFQES